MLRLIGAVLAAQAVAATGGDYSQQAALEEVEGCQVVVIGGSVAGLAAAVTSAKEGAVTCLLEPTDMIGGQMTANGIPALDFSSEDARVPFNESGGASDTLMVNQAHDLTAILRSIAPVPDYRHTCWVSAYCYLPTVLAAGGIQQLLDSAGPKLRIFRQTVLLNATTTTTTTTTTAAAETAASAAGQRQQDEPDQQSSRIESVVAVQRTPTTAGSECGGYKKRLSQSMADWYSPTPSDDFDKHLLRFTAPVYLDTSYNGELLVLSGAPYLQGIDEKYDGDTSGASAPGVGNDTIGQSFTMTFQIHMLSERVEQHDETYPPMEPAWEPNPYRASPAIHTPTDTLNFTSLWSRRRSYHQMPPPPLLTGGKEGGKEGGHGGLSLGMNPPADSWGNVTVGDVSLMACVV
jgi:hypothetical protein